MDRLANSIQNYAWGSSTQLSEFLGKPASGEPEAELWLGAHPKSPSKLGTGELLSLAIQRQPRRLLGESVRRAFHGKLPFLLKVLAVSSPLSLQAHPNSAQAIAGFRRENEEGVPLDAPHRTYKDDSHKPELLCALTPFEALCGFRPREEAATLLEPLGPRGRLLATRLREPRDEGDGLKRAFSFLLELTPEEQRTWTRELLAPLRKAALSGSTHALGYQWAVRLNEQYPGDAGAIASLLLHHVRLQPGQALFLEAGVLHAYLSGMGVEIMASSDNVLRGGLTPKHIDVPELLRVLRFESRSPSLAKTAEDGEVTAYLTPAPEFRLERITCSDQELSHRADGPEIFLCTEGGVELHASSGLFELRRGESVFAEHGEQLTLTGRGVVFLARVNPCP